MKIGDSQQPFQAFRKVSHNTTLDESQSTTSKTTETRKLDDKVTKKKSKKNSGKNSNNSEDHSDELTIEEMAVLKQYINPIYLSTSTMIDINQQFCENSSLQLNDFIRHDIMQIITKHLILADEDDQIGGCYC